MATRKRTNSAAMDKTSQPGVSKAIVPVNSVVRLQRNQAEKQRRDRLNGYISELATLVPMVKNSSKPVDKVSVLRLAAAQMRLKYSCLNPKYFRNKTKALPPPIASYLQNLEKDIGGFTVVTTFSGTVLFCSKSIEYFAGYQNIDFMGQCIYNYVHPEELSFFERKVNSIISRYKKGKKTSKLIRLHLQKRPLPRTNDVSYQKMSFRISVHFNDLLQEQTMDDKAAAKSKKIKHKDFGSSAVLLMFVEPVKHNPDNSLLTNPNVYVTIHGVTGEIMYADHRISIITGYMPKDVLQKSAYEYIFESDVPIAQFAQRDMFSSNNGTGVITYRLRTINSEYIYLQSKGQIVYKESSNEISHFICYNKWLSDDEGAEELKKFHKRYSAQSVKAMQMLEKAQENKSDYDESSLSVLTKGQAFISCKKSFKENNVHQSVNDQSESLKSSSESNIILNSAHNENEYSKQSLFKTESCKESKIAQINHSVNNTIAKDYEKIDTCSYNQNHTQNSDECQNDFNDGHPFIQEHSKSLEKFTNDSKDNFNSLNSMNGYSCIQQSHLKLKIFRGNNFAQISNSNFENNTPLVNYEKMDICNGTNDYMVDKQIVKQSTVNDFEKINGHHYNQTYDCIVNKPLIKHKNSVHLLSPSLNSERIQDPKSAQYPTNFLKNAHNGSYCNYFGEDSKDLSLSLSNEIPQPFMAPIHDMRWQNQASCIKPIDSYKSCSDVQTNELSSSIHNSYQVPFEYQNSNFINAFPTHRTFYKKNESVSHKNMDISYDQLNPALLGFPFKKDNFLSPLHNPFEDKPIRMPDVNNAHQNGTSYHLNSSRNGAFHNSQEIAQETTTYSNGFSPKREKFCGNDLFGSDVSNTEVMGFQKLNILKNILEEDPENEFPSKLDCSNISHAYSECDREKWQLLNNNLWDTKFKKDNGIPASMSKDCNFKKKASETFSEMFFDKGNQCESEKDQLLIVSSFTVRDCTSEATIHQELYNELDMFFENIPSSETAQNESFEFAQ